jgi:hypothetical protein
MKTKEVTNKNEFEPKDYAGKTFKVRLKAADMWSGVQKFDNCRVILYPSIDRFGRKVTGLNPEDQVRLEEALGFDPGFLAPNSKYWKDFFVQISDKGLTLDTNDPFQELQYLYLKRSNKIAKSLKSIPPSAIAVMYSEEEEAKVSNLSRGIRTKAFTTFGKMSHDDMKKILVMYGKRAVDSMANDVIEDTLGAEIDLNPGKFLTIVSDPLIENKLFLTGLLNKGVIKKIGNVYKYGEVTLGSDLDESVKFLGDKTNQPILLALKELK